MKIEQSAYINLIKIQIKKIAVGHLISDSGSVIEVLVQTC